MRDYLFGFTTVRNPASIAPLERSRFHILMIESDRRRTHFWSGLNRDTFVGLVQEVHRRAVNFHGIPSFQALEASFANLLAFYREAKAEIRRVDLSDLHELSTDLQAIPLTSAQRVLLWDSFAHYLWVDEKKAAIDAIRSIMIADKLLNALEDVTAAELQGPENQAILRRILDAQVVIPLPLDRTANPRSPGDVMSARQRNMLEAAHDRLVGGAEANDLIRARDDLSFAISRHRMTRRTNERDAQSRSANLIRSELSSAIPARDVERVASALASRLTTENRMPENEVATVLGTITSSATIAVLQPLHQQALTLSALTDSLDRQIDEAEANLGGEIEVAHLATFLAFGAEFTIEESIPPGAIIVKAKRSSNNRYTVYLSYFHDRKRPQLIEVSGIISGGANPVTIAPEALEIDDNRFQTFRLSSETFQGVLNVSLNLRTAAPNAPLANLDPFPISLQVPHFDVPDLSEDPVIGIQPPPLFAINRLGVIDYRRVEQELACYVTGEVSRIENIPARSFKERNSRTLSVTEIEQEVTQELASERQSDTETAEKLEMQTEIENVLREEKGKTFDFGAGVSIELPGTGSLTTNTNLNFNSQSSREDSTTQAINMAKSITQKVQEKLVQKATMRRKSLSRTEFEDIVKSGFDNRLGGDHVVCIYRWVDKIMNNFLVNYGRMSVIEFEIPEPAKNFIRAQETTREEEDFKVRRPKRPRLIGLHGPSSVRRNNYRNFAAIYGIELDPPPPDTIVLSRAFADSLTIVGAGDDHGSPNRSVAYNEIGIPDGYVAVSAAADSESASALSDDGAPFGSGGSFAEGPRLDVSIGDNDFEQPLGFDDKIELNKIEGSVGVGVMAMAAGAFALQVRITCQLKSEVYGDWQHRAYSKLIAAYQKLKDEYDEQRAAHEEEQNKKLDLNPRFKKQVMERELKRVCIQIMTQQHNIDITGDHYGPAPEGKLHPLILSQQLDRHSELVRFLEQAINWPLMSYIFYPYFYAKEETWAVKISHEATNDQLFASFLSSGMGRVAVPIYPGFEAAFNYFLDTGEVWFGNGFVLDSEDDLYLSIADEMLRGTEEHVIEESWQTKLPTNNTIIQSAAAAMIGEGLPCEISDNRIGLGSSTLAPVLPPESTVTPT
jgi:hypothetical protein